jgi:Arc/MetJ-type ribon-helix-helix transcriptional regulator
MTKSPSQGRPRTLGGRPPLMPPLPVRFPGPMVQEIDTIVAGRFDQPDRSSVIRELLAEALAARRNADVS